MSRPANDLQKKLKILDAVEALVGEPNYTAIGKQFDVSRKTVACIVEQSMNMMINRDYDVSCS